MVYYIFVLTFIVSTVSLKRDCYLFQLISNLFNVMGHLDSNILLFFLSIFFDLIFLFLFFSVSFISWMIKRHMIMVTWCITWCNIIGLECSRRNWNNNIKDIVRIIKEKLYFILFSINFLFWELGLGFSVISHVTVTIENGRKFWK